MPVATKPRKNKAAAASGASSPGPGRPPASQYVKEYKEAIATATTALVKKVDAVKKKLSALDDSAITERHEIGAELNDIKAHPDQYGEGVEQTMIALMPVGRDTLRPMMKFAEQYDDADVKAMLAIKHKETGEGLTWYHVAIMTRIKTKADALALAEKAVHQGWSTRDFNQAAVKLNGGRKSKGGRPAKKTLTLDATLTDVMTRIGACDTVAKDVWLHHEEGLSDQYFRESAEWPGKRPSQETIDQLIKTKEVLESFQVRFKSLLLQVDTLVTQAEAARNRTSPLQDTLDNKGEDAEAA